MAVKDPAALRKHIDKAGLTQTDVARYAGVSVGMIGHLLPSADGTRPPRRETVLADVAAGISAALGVPITRHFKIKVKAQKG
jgi:transcriptional regulator with XRE-family HTH domain